MVLLVMPASQTETFMTDTAISSAEASGTKTVARPRLSVVVPTYCEAGNIATMVAALDAALAGIRWEVIFVDDDSPDGTMSAIRSVGEHDNRVRGMRRVGTAWPRRSRDRGYACLRCGHGGHRGCRPPAR